MARRTQGLAEYRNLVLKAASSAYCPKGHAWRVEPAVSMLMLHGLLASVQCQVHDTICSDPTCSERNDWSGDDEAIHRHSRTMAFTYELHRGFLAEIKDSKSPAVYTFWKKRVEQRLNTTPFCSIGTFQAATWSLHRALDLDYPKEFSCEFCGDLIKAPIWIVDGKALICQPGGFREETALITSGQCVWR